MIKEQAKRNILEICRILDRKQIYGIKYNNTKSPTIPPYIQPTEQERKIKWGMLNWMFLNVKPEFCGIPSQLRRKFRSYLSLSIWLDLIGTRVEENLTGCLCYFYVWFRKKSSDLYIGQACGRPYWNNDRKKLERLLNTDDIEMIMWLNFFFFWNMTVPSNLKISIIWICWRLTILIF